MNESLNLAFIRAYDKEKSSEARRKVEADKQQADALAGLMVQFDTATVQIPAPHMLKAQKRREPVAVSSPPQLAETVRPTQVETKTPRPTTSLSADALRGSIAEQMMQATNWEEQTVATFTSEIRLPQVPQTVQRQAGVQVQPAGAPVHDIHANLLPRETVAVDVAAADGGQSTESSPIAIEPSPVGVPQKSPREAVASVPEEQTTAPEIATALTSENSAQTPQPAVKAPLILEVEPADAPAASKIKVPDLVSPATPALSPETMETGSGAASSRQEWAGNIFRLDRPSYDRPRGGEASYGTAQSNPTRQDVFRGQAAADSVQPYYDDVDDEPSEVSDTLLLDHARIEVEHPHSAPQTPPQSQPSVNYFPAKPATRNLQVDAEALAVEKKLRSAKLRIFNPVWEVDNLQWPPVCLELMHRMSSSFKSIAENLAMACQEGLQVMAVTSPQRGEGTTTVACCLALLAGSHGLNVAIVDGDIEKPTLSYQTNLDVDQDWCGALLHNLSLEEVAIHSIDDQVTVVPLLNPISEQEMTTSDERIINMMEELSASFDLVILDAGRIDSTRSLIRSLGERGLISAAVAVVDHRSSTPDRIEACLRRIRQAGVHSIGLIENFAA